MTMVSNPIAVLGAGSWGTALALLLARNGNEVRLWSHEPEHIKILQEQRENRRYLPGYAFPDNLQIDSNLGSILHQITDVLIAVPSHAFRSVIEKLRAETEQDLRIVWGTKGVDPQTCQLLHQVVAEVFQPQTQVAVLSGPSFATEVAASKPTAVSLAGNDSDFLQSLVDRFHNDTFRVYLNTDMIGVEICGAIKNVLAIAVGISDGLELGANSRCALITRGLAEMSRLCVAYGGKKETLLGMCGVGDLVLTCTDDQSRNRRFGLALGRGESTELALKNIGQAVEGLQNTKQIYQMAQTKNVELPITEQVHAVICNHHSPEDILQELLKRKPKFES